MRYLSTKFRDHVRKVPEDKLKFGERYTKQYKLSVHVHLARKVRLNKAQELESVPEICATIIILKRKIHDTVSPEHLFTPVIKNITVLKSFQIKTHT